MPLFLYNKLENRSVFFTLFFEHWQYEWNLGHSEISLVIIILWVWTEFYLLPPQVLFLSDDSEQTLDKCYRVQQGKQSTDGLVSSPVLCMQGHDQGWWGFKTLTCLSHRRAVIRNQGWGSEQPGLELLLLTLTTSIAYGQLSTFTKIPFSHLQNRIMLCLYLTLKIQCRK